MKKIVGLFFSLYCFAGYSACDVYIPEKTFYHDSGYSINFEFDSILSSKRYFEVGTKDATYVLTFHGEEIRGRFRKARAILSMGETHIQKEVTCFYMTCGITDYQKAFSKAFSEFSKNLKECR